MQEKIKKYINDIKKTKALTIDDAQKIKKHFLAKNGVLNDLFLEFKKLSNDEKKQTGKLLNTLKKIAEEKIEKIEKGDDLEKQKNELDVTMPPNYEALGAEHPLTRVKNQIIEIFNKVGFSLSDGQLETCKTHFLLS